MHIVCIMLEFAITWHVHTPAALFQLQGIGLVPIPSSSHALREEKGAQYVLAATVNPCMVAELPGLSQ